MAQHAQVVEYKSTISVPGASYCSIWKYNVANNEVYDWNCTTFNSPNFMQARAKFKEIYDQIEIRSSKLMDKSLLSSMHNT
ncbi:MAG: hypothetical protein WDM78_21785 [Puia sp.]